MKEKITKKLRDNLTVKNLEVTNNSYLHKGHLGDNGTGETHFDLVICAEELEGMKLIDAHRKIKEILKEEFSNGLHALTIKVKK